MSLVNMDADFRVKTTQDAACEEIAFAIGESALGTVLVARSAEGVCAILIGSEPAELEGDLASRFTESKLVRDDRKLGDDLRKILRFIETPAEGLDLPLDIRGTPFQRRVWGCPARDSGRVHRDLWGARRPHRPTEICSRRCKRLRCQCPSPGDPVPSRHQKQWHSFRLLLGRRA